MKWVIKGLINYLKSKMISVLQFFVAKNSGKNIIWYSSKLLFRFSFSAINSIWKCDFICIYRIDSHTMDIIY